MKSWEVVIGIETHVQLLTHSKIFSGSSTAFGAEPNAQANVVDIALPGTLPVLNKKAVECAIRFGLSVGADIAPRSIFARKHYFYPDLPKGYQVSQYEKPVVCGGEIVITLDGEDAKTRTIRLTRAHLEEDAGKSLHEAFQTDTGIDLNRAGTPLLEIVTEPDLRSSAEAVAYARTLHALVQWIGICDGNMQEGSFRCDANVSVRRVGDQTLGTRREIKNLNSFRFLQQAIDYEAAWQIETLESGRSFVQATVLFDPATGETREMRTKEDAHDYRYFPDPDLLPLEISVAWIKDIQNTLPELPAQKQARFMTDFGLSPYDANALTSTAEIAAYYEALLKEIGQEHAKIAANWVMAELSAHLNKAAKSISESPVSPETLGGLLRRIIDQTLSNNIAKKVFEALWQGDGKSADDIIERDGLRQITDTHAIEALIDEVLARNAPMVAEFKAGKEKAFNALVGQAMKATKGKANPQQVNALLKEKLG